MDPGALVDIDIEKPAAGGRMLGRHHGQVVLVWGAIPGERVQARIERVAKGVVYAETIDVLSASADRRAVGGDWRCGGNVLAHVSYPRQLQIKGQIVQDALGRIGRVPLPTVPEVIGSPEQGYRMRARLHVRDGRIGFYREGTHELCDAGATGQLLPATIAWMAAAERVLARREVRLKPDTTHETHETHGGGGIAAIELAENIAGDERACHLELHAGVEPSSFASLGEGLTGLSAQRADRRAGERLAGTPAITDVIRVAEGDGAPTLRLRRDVRAFFQSNRFLLERLVQHVAALVPSGPVVDLYAGVGLFGLSLATAGAEAVTLVEGDPVSSADLRTNAEPFAGRVRVTRQSVEAYVAQEHGRGTADETFIVDPPRTGMSKDALAGTIAAAPRRIVYVSCDVATLARDTRTLLDAGYALEQITGIDLFPNTAHVESVALFTR